MRWQSAGGMGRAPPANGHEERWAARQLVQVVRVLVLVVDSVNCSRSTAERRALGKEPVSLLRSSLGTEEDGLG